LLSVALAAARPNGYCWSHRLPGNVRGDAMSDTENEFDRTDDILICEVSDEALEIAAGDERAGHYTLYFCTALDLCPGP